jgi:glyoxylase-like metal-dependent hydrolase (beta-lactamase superfamily II)
VFPGLYALARQPLPFGPSFDIRAFLLRREPGNLLVYSVNGLASVAPALQDLGDIARQYLNHWHESLFATDRVDAPLFCHENDREAVVEKTPVSGTFSQRHWLDDDFEVIPIPGHTRGATAYLWNNGEQRFLFTGDTIYLKEGEWIAAVLETSDRPSYIESLQLLRERDFDVLVPWLATRGQPCHALTDRADARRRIDAILERVRRGEDH